MLQIFATEEKSLKCSFLHFYYRDMALKQHISSRYNRGTFHLLLPVSQKVEPEISEWVKAATQWTHCGSAAHFPTEDVFTVKLIWKA